MPTVPRDGAPGSHIFVDWTFRRAKMKANGTSPRLACFLDKRGTLENASPGAIKSCRTGTTAPHPGGTGPRTCADKRGATMRVGLLQGKPGEDPGGLAAALRQWVAQADYSHWVLEIRSAWTGSGIHAAAQRLDVLVLADALIPNGPWLEEWLASGIGVVVAAAGPRLELYRALAERWPLSWVPPQPSVECLGYAILSAGASRRRQLALRGQIDQ